jgi:hypothetical protein
MSNYLTQEEIEAWLRRFVEPKSVIELRVLRYKTNLMHYEKTVAGYFDEKHLQDLVQNVMHLTYDAEGCYVTINPVNPELLARAKNRVTRGLKCLTTDSDILRRIGLVLDADPVKPAGISATEAEKEAVRERIEQLVSHLHGLGWPEPILADSGNGYHARYRIELPADDGGLVERVLRTADARFTDDKVKIDKSLGNASRIIKRYGTLSRKGDNTQDRPHRWTRVCSIPDEYRVVPADLLEAFAAEGVERPVAVACVPDVMRSVENRVSVAGDRSSPEGRARAYVFAPGFPDSVAGQHGHDRLYHAAAVLVDGFGLTYDRALPIFEEWNQKKARPPESERQVRHKLESAIKNHPVPSLSLLNADRAERSRNGKPTVASAPAVTNEQRDSTGLALVTKLASQYRIEPVEFLDGGLLPKKLITVAGMGGVGKGMFWANIVADLTQGRPTMGMTYEAPPPIDVLLIGCEDGYSDTVMPRLRAADADMDRVHVLEGAKDSKGRLCPFSLAYLAPMEDFLCANPAIGMIVIDPITGYVGRAGVKDHHDAELRSVLEPLADLANRYKITIMTTKHLNKDEAQTVASRVGGSVAYVNVSRACFVVASDPDDDARRVLAPFKWNLNTKTPAPISWTIEPIDEDRRAAILADCEHLKDEDKEKLRGQLHKLTWAGTVDVTADDLLKRAARVAGKPSQNEVSRAMEWLRMRLSDGPVGSIACAREGDLALGRPWPPPGKPDELENRVFGRIKWWREIILKRQLQGESHRAGYNGPYFFRLPEHLARGLWPPTADAIVAARQIADGETSSGMDDDPWKPSESAEDGVSLCKPTPEDVSHKAATTASTGSDAKAGDASTDSTDCTLQGIDSPLDLPAGADDREEFEL